MINNEHEWEIELDDMVARLRYVLNNLDEIPERKQVRYVLEDIQGRLRELVALCKGE